MILSDELRNELNKLELVDLDQLLLILSTAQELQDHPEFTVSWAIDRALEELNS